MLFFISRPPYETVSLKVWVVVPPRFEAVIVNVYVPAVPLAGVPERTPVVALSATPLGRCPDVIVNVGAGNPVAVTSKPNEWPTCAEVDEALVKTGFVVAAKLKELVDDDPLMFESPTYDALTE
jgi:hypothetical protein